MLQTHTNLIFNGLQVSWLPTDQQILWILRPHPVPTGLQTARRPVTCMDIPARWSRPGLTHFCFFIATPLAVQAAGDGC